jgi:hypothetical protein
MAQNQKYVAEEHPFSIASIMKTSSPKRDTQNDSGYSAISDSGSDSGTEFISVCFSEIA